MKEASSEVIILHVCTKNYDHIYGSWDIRHARQFFCHFGSFFVFDPPNNPKNQNLEKIKIRPGDIIILHLCTTNDNHVMYGSWNMEHGRQNFLSFWTIFCPFTPLTSWKIKIMRKWKNKKQTNKQTHLEILSFYTCVP